MACQPATCDLWSAGIAHRRRAQAIEAENGFVIGILNREESFRTAPLMALASVTAQEFVQRLFAAIERFPIMFLANRRFVPRHHDYHRLGNARAAARSFAFGAGGFSSKSSTRKLSLAERRT